MIKISYFVLIVLIINFNLSVAEEDDSKNRKDIYEQDLTDTYKIEASDQGVQKVNLKCGADSMYVQLETGKDFTGVMYTRGSFHKQTEPCFVKPKNGRSRSLDMHFSLNQCQTQQEGDVFSNIVVIQNDPELVTPGDSAFSLECDFRKPRSLQVESEMQARERIPHGSRITLTSPDPSIVVSLEDEKLYTVYNNSDTVTYIPAKSVEIVKGTVEDVPLNQEQARIYNDELEKI